MSQTCSRHPVFAEAIWDHVALGALQLAFLAGDVIEVTYCADRDWWWGRVRDKEGWFPSCFAKVKNNHYLILNKKFIASIISMKR